MNDALVTIVIPTFNRADRLRVAIESCLAQSVDVSVIVVDHGSSDKTSDVAVSFGTAIDYVRRETDSGPEFAWLDGLVRVKTEFSKLLFDDDWLDPFFVETCLLNMHENSGFVFSNAKVVSEPSGRTFSHLSPESRALLRDRRRYPTSLIPSLVSPSQMLNRTEDLLDSVHVGQLPFQTTSHHGAGSDHWVKLLTLLRDKSWTYVDAELVSFGAHEGSITVGASLNSSRTANLERTYDQVTEFYIALRLARCAGIFSIASVIRGHLRLVARARRRIFRTFVLVKRITGRLLDRILLLFR